MLKDKKIILGITGSIAAYKAALLLRLLVKEGAEVQVIITAAGREFIGPVTLSALSGRPVLGDFFENRDGTWHSHVDLGLWADAMLIAPATANTMGKMVAGICDNLLITTYLSVRCPVFIAPAMDLDMYKHPSTDKNIQTLKSWENYIIEPAVGELASGLSGKGRMEEPDVIVEHLKNFFSQEKKKKTLSEKSFLVTAGPTYELLDPVRFIGNFSSGKMGFAIAEVLADRGARVELVAGPVHLSTSHPQIIRHNVISADEMYKKCVEIFPSVDGAIMVAAVSDYAPLEKMDTKLKRKDEELIISLKQNPDIAKKLGEMKTTSQILAGFALETNDELANASKKLAGKNFDFIVLNSLKTQGAGFMEDTNKITIISEKNKTFDFPLKSKTDVAKDIIDHLETIM